MLGLGNAWRTATSAIANINENITTVLEGLDKEINANLNSDNDENNSESDTNNTSFEDDESILNRYKAEIQSYKSLLEEAQMDYVKLSKQLSIALIEKDTEINSLKSQLTDKSNSNSNNSIETIESTNNDSNHNNKYKDSDFEKILIEKITLEKLIEDLEKKYYDSLQLGNESKANLNKYNSIFNKYNQLLIDFEKKSETVESLVDEYSKLAAETELKQTNDNQRINNILKENEQLVMRINALELNLTDFADRAVQSDINNLNGNSNNNTVHSTDIKELKTKLANLQYDYNEKVNVINTLEKQIESLKSSNISINQSDNSIDKESYNNLLDQFNNQKKDIEQLIIEKNESNEAGKNFYNKNKLLTKEIENLKIQIENLVIEKSNNTIMNDKLIDLQTQLDNKVNLINELENQNNLLNKLIHDLNGQIVVLSDDINSYKNKISDLTTQLSTVSNESNIKISSLEESMKLVGEHNDLELSQQINDLTNQLLSITNESNNKINSLQQTNDLINKKLIEQENELNKIIFELNKQLSDLTTESNEKINSLQQTNELISKKLIEQENELNNKIFELNKQLDDLTTESNEKVTSLKSINLSAEKKKVELNNQLDNLNIKLNQIIKESNEKIYNLQSTLDSTTLEFKQTVDNKTNEMNLLDSRYRVQVLDLADQISNLSNELNHNKLLYNNQLTIKLELENAINESKLTIEKLTNDVNDLIIQHKNKITELTNQHDNNIKSLESNHRIEINSLNDKINQYIAEIQRADQKYEEKTRERFNQIEKQKELEKSNALEEQRQALQSIIDKAISDKEEYFSLYLKENKQRKQIHNKLLELQGNIRVICRIRPILEVERKSGEAIDVTSCPTPEDVIIQRDPSTKTKFEFDRVFPAGSLQVEVFEAVKPLIVSALDGYNVCIFAYGQTGSGKTYTMEGYGSDIGVSPRAFKELFDIVEERKDNYSYTLSFSMLEIYNESILDLLDSNPNKEKLDIRQTPEGNVVPGLIEIPISSPDQVAELLLQGQANRAVGSHDMNEHSSRSHSILTITCRGKLLHSSNQGNSGSTFGKLHLIDLAGSERVGKTDATGDRLKEAQNINKSLSALGDVIAALGNKKSTHIPYRNSKLTFLLQDSLGGNSKVLMFVNISPAIYNMGETICSLNFAIRCRNVELGQASVNSSANLPSSGSNGMRRISSGNDTASTASTASSISSANSSLLTPRRPITSSSIKK